MAKVKIKNKSGVNLHGIAPGGSAEIAVDKEGTPLDRNWRRRFKDAELDNCVEIVTTKKKKEEVSIKD